MRKKRLSIVQQIMQEAIEKLNRQQNDVTRKAYIRNTKKYIYFCRENFNCRSFEECKNYIQDYADYLKMQGYTPSTIHTYIAAVCAAFDVKMDTIDKPKRIVSKFIRNRSIPKNMRTSQDLENPKWAYIVEFQKRVGIRRNELLHLKGKDFVETPQGAFVHVNRGKGGKKQYQRIMAEDVGFIKKYFCCVEKEDYVFDKKYFANALPFHKLRAECARDCYFKLLKQVQENPAFLKILEKEIRQRWQENKDKRGRVKPFPENEIRGYYTLRGGNRNRAIEKGLPISYNKTILLWVSIFKLSHYRNNIAATNYMLA